MPKPRTWIDTRGVKHYIDGKEPEEMARIRGVVQALEAELKYPLDQKEAENMVKRLRGKLVWMTPTEFLRNVPHPLTEIVPASFDLSEKGYSKSSIDYITDAYLKGRPLEPLWLDYTWMQGRFPAHEGRHRALVANKLGMEKIPVVVAR